MGSYYDYFKSLASDYNKHLYSPYSAGLGLISTIYDKEYNSSHGGKRYALSQVPVLGWIKQLQDRMQYYQDYYDQTGKDVRYSQNYSGTNLNSLGGVSSGSLKPIGMARSLDRLYGCDVSENVGKSIRNQTNNITNNFY